MKVGNTVRLKQPSISGEILDTQYNKTAMELEHLVPWTDSEGEVQQRFFLESTLELVGEQDGE
jgi:hypothetical protein